MRILPGLVAIALVVVGACSGVAPTSTPTPTQSASAVPTLSPVVIFVTPAPTAEPTPSPTVAPTTAPTATPTTAPVTPKPTPTKTPGPTPFTEEPGTIYFGRDYDPDTLYVVDPQESFQRNANIAWSASLSEPAGATTLTFVLAKLIGAGNAERIEYTQEVEISNPDFDIFANKARLGSFVSGKGRFVMRYLREGTTLAEGIFELR